MPSVFSHQAFKCGNMFYMNIHESMEDYLETILILGEKGRVRNIDVVAYTGFSKPSVSIAMKKLKEKGYIDPDEPKYLVLTEEGKAIATKIYEKHKVLCEVLTKLGVSPEVAREDACKIEHELSDETFEAIKAHMRNNK